MAENLPSGTVTFLFTDIEGSTSIAQHYPEAWESLRAQHNAILRAGIEAHGGHLFQIVGDACCAAFDTAAAGCKAAVAIQRDLQDQAWGDQPVRVRMGLHTGEAQPQAGDYRGYLTLTHVQRVMSAAHGGQILLSNSTAELVRGELADEIGLRDLGPHRLRSLPRPEHLWQLIAPRLRHDFPLPESLGTIPNNLPVQLTTFVGRDTELQDLGKLLRSHRLVTLTGAGGTGKTRLALQLADALFDDFKDGVWFIELAPLSDPALVPHAVTSVLNVSDEPGRPSMDTLLDWLEGRQLLLLLDNCEHLIEASARLADAILHSNRESRILATSREALGIPGEAAYHIPSLDSPESTQASAMDMQELAKYAAVHLFVDRAREAVAGFQLTGDNAPQVAQICRRLDGIPLAIELAAARVKVLGVGQIAARLDDRFRLLTGGARLTLPRHQTLRSLIDWSYGLLNEPERLLLARLSAFAGGWSLEAAEQVCGGHKIQPSEILDLLARLVDKSLVSVTSSAQESRYGMLETIRQYALEKLIDSGEAEEVRGRHLKFMSGLVEVGAVAQALYPDQSLWFDRMELELDNLRAALEWALRLPDPQDGLRMAGSLHWFWFTRGHWHEGRRWLEEVLGRPGSQAHTQGRAWALTALGFLRLQAGQYPAAQSLFDESARICRELGDRRSLVQALAWPGSFAGLWDDSAGGSKILEEALQLSRELDDGLGVGLSLVGFGNLSVSEGNDADAQAYYEDGSKYLRLAGDKTMFAWARRRLGYVALRRGDYRQAIALCRESLQVNLEIRDIRGVAASLAALASIAAGQQRAATAARLYGASDALLESRAEQLTPVDVAEIAPFIKSARAQLGAAGYSRSYSDGRSMKMEQAIAFATEQPAE